METNRKDTMQTNLKTKTKDLVRKHRRDIVLVVVPTMITITISAAAGIRVVNASKIVSVFVEAPDNVDLSKVYVYLIRRNGNVRKLTHVPD